MKFLKFFALPLFVLSLSLITAPEAQAQGLEMSIDPGCVSPFFEGWRVNKDCNGFDRDTWGTQNSGTAIFWPANYDTYLIQVCDAFGACVWIGPAGSGYPQSASLTFDKAVYDGYYPCQHPTVAFIHP